MQTTRRIVALATAATGLLAVAAAPAAAAPRGPQPVSTWLQSVRANTSSWVNIYWRTDRRICDVEVRVRAEQARVDYPGNARSATFSRGDSLFPGRTDFTRIRVTPFLQRQGVTQLWTTMTYDDCGFKARPQTRTAVLSLPVLRADNWPGGPGGPGGPGQGQPGGQGQGQGQPGGPGQGQPGGPGQGQPGGPGAGGPGGPGNGPGGPGNNQGGPGGQNGPGQGGPMQGGPGGPGQGQPGGGQNGQGGPWHGGTPRP
ncbi:hypothetical protein [Actinoplanes sp. NBRC 101535]|uniref:hypothetical protein n=1 Tax=Actinoplanes sp. NBRC 101535 TaxID=3032196 RepID=UPI0024A555AF|nr:hypothetical protein [Actinoplanes sp. NBRC 101535]GLY01325.1 hypothetical protein Acsp01_17040 [Actinoplanes sp. NBRC 101535]